MEAGWRGALHRPDRKMMAVPVIEAAFEPGIAVPLFDTNVIGFFPYDVSTDGSSTHPTAPKRRQCLPLLY